MIYRSPQNPNSHLTVKERRYPSYPTKQLLKMNLIRGKVLDFGCGLGVDVKYLKSKGFDVIGYDPYYQPNYPNDKFDTILCNYVLNVLLPEEQAHVLMAVSELLKPVGKAYFSVRRDLKYNGFRFNPKQNCRTYQTQVVLPYKSILRTEHCEIYEYQHINKLRKPEKNPACEFCQPPSDFKLLTESATVYAIGQNWAQNEYQVAVIPKRHTNDFFQLNYKEQFACILVINRVKYLIESKQKIKDLSVNLSSGKENYERVALGHYFISVRIEK